jgi:hypothetical protein
MCGNGGIDAANGKELVNLANNRVHFELAIHSDAVTGATGRPVNVAVCSGMYLSSVSYTIPVDGNATEDITLVGNNKGWRAGQDSDRAFVGGLPPSETAPSIGRRYRFNTSASKVPTVVSSDNRKIQSITISTDLGRDSINELGRQSPYFRYVNFPVEVTSEFEIIATEGDNVTAVEAAGTNCGITPNLTDEEVKVVMCGSSVGDSLTIDLGKKNKLTSVNYTGGDTGGGNATVTYSYQTFNKLVVTGNGTFKASSYVDNG